MYLKAQVPGETARPITTRRVLNNKPSKPSVRSTQTQVVITKPVYIEKPSYPTGLYVYTSPFTNITLQPINPGKGVKKIGKADDKGLLTFDKLQPGKYRLSASLEDFQPQETEIKIELHKIAQTAIDLKKITHDFSIITNIKNGEVRFAPVEILGGTNSDGTVKVRETGNYCVVPIENRKAIIKDLAEGNYNIDVRTPDAPEYQPELAVIKIPESISAINSNDSNENKEFEINLEKKLSELDFNQISNKDAWKLSEKWNIEAGVFKANGVGKALPINETFKYYKDFELQASVRLMDNTSVGFMVRAKDEDNYYLIQLTAGNSKQQPYLVSGFIVKDGKLGDRVLGNPIKFMEKSFKDHKDISIIIKAVESTVKIFVEDQTGRHSLGEAEFKDNNFPIGAVGLVAIENSNFEVRRFSVCNKTCSK